MTATLYVTSRPAQTMTQVNAAGECGLSNGFYREPHEGSDFEDFVLCPGPCRDVTESGGSVDIKLDCGAEPVR